MEADSIKDWDRLTEGEKFVMAYQTMIHRKGADKLLEALERDGFFSAPASTKYHGSYPGGLVEHSNEVFRRLIMMAMDRSRGVVYGKSVETLAIVSLLHDVCKTKSYESYDGRYIYSEKDLPLGHGEKSVYMIMKYMDLTDEEALAIRWHMGAYDKAAIADSRDLNRAMKQSSLVTMLHLADMQATYL